MFNASKIAEISKSLPAIHYHQRYYHR